MYIKVFIVNVNKCLKPFILEQHINIVNRVTLQSFWFIFTCLLLLNLHLLVFHRVIIVKYDFYIIEGCPEGNFKNSTYR